MADKNSITNLTLLKEYARYVSLNIFSMIGLSCYILVDTFFIANGVGADGLTALNLALPMFALITAFGFLISVGTGTRYSICRARGWHEEGDRLFTHGVVAAFGIGLVFIFIRFAFTKPFVILMGAQGNLIPLTEQYMKTFLMFAPFFILNNTLNNMVKNDGNPRCSMIATIAGSMANIVMDYIFIYPMGMGMFGAALATGISPIVGISILSTHFLQKRNGFKLARCKLSLTTYKEIGALGTSSFFAEIASMIVMVVFNKTILSITGNIGVASYGVIANLAIVVIAFFNGIAQGIQPLVSTSYGKGDLRTGYKVFRYAAGTTMAAALILYFILYVWATPIVELFNGEHITALREYATVGVRIYFFGIFFAGFNTVITTFFNSREEVKKAFCITLLRGGLVIIPAVLLLTFLFDMNGVWLSYPVSEGLVLIVAVILFCPPANDK